MSAIHLAWDETYAIAAARARSTRFAQLIERVPANYEVSMATNPTRSGSIG